MIYSWFISILKFPLRYLFELALNFSSFCTDSRKRKTCMYIWAERERWRNKKAMRKSRNFYDNSCAFLKIILNNLHESSNLRFSCYTANFLRWGTWTLKQKWMTDALSHFLTFLSKPRVHHGDCSSMYITSP